MDKVTFKSVGGSFNPNPDDPHNLSISTRNNPKYIKWLSKSSTQQPDFLFYIDDGLQEGLKNNQLKYGMIIESKIYIHHYIDHILNNMELYKQHYKHIFTYFLELADLGPPFTYSLCAGLPRTEVWNRKIHPKSKLVSMLVSVNSSLPGHQNRLSYMEKYKHCMDVYGRGRPTQLENVEDAYKDYMFSVGMENQITDAYFTDKITDPIANGAVPIYCGSKWAVEKYLDPEGVLWTDNINIETDISRDLYENMMPHIINNYNIVMNDLPTGEDYLYQNFLIG